MAFTRELWKSIEPIYAAILEHPFLRGLTDGSLPRESFKFYAVQDALYLREFARALSLAAARAPEDDWIVMFNEHSAGALKVERALHEGFFKEFGLSPAEVAATPLAPTRMTASRSLPYRSTISGPPDSSRVLPTSSSAARPRVISSCRFR
jgi:thiaminase/transcriptional activator TenA